MDTSYLFELYKSGLSLLLLVIGWVFGQRLLVTWERRKKRNEVAIATLAEFQRLYGEFKLVGRLWRRSGDARQPANSPLNIPDNHHWELHCRAADAESRMEAIVVKLATERRLSDREIEALGLIRECFQMMRRAIRDKQWFFWAKSSGHYELLNELAVTVASMLLDELRTPPARETAIENVRRITSISSSDVEASAAKRGNSPVHHSTYEAPATAR